jgi:hypothetical protein
MARGAPGEEGYTPQVQPEDLPRKIVPRLEAVPVGSVFEQAANASEAKYKADSATYAGEQLAELRSQAVQSLQAAKDAQSADEDPSAFTDKFLKTFDGQAKPLTSNSAISGNPIAQKMIADGVTTLRQTLQEHTLSWQAHQQVAYRENSFYTQVKTNAAVVEAHPELLASVGSTLKDVANSIGGDPSKRLEHMRAMDSVLSEAAANGLSRQDPRGALKALNDPEKAPPQFANVISRLTDAQRETMRQKANEGLTKPIYSLLEDNDFKGAQKKLLANRDVMDPKTLYAMQNIIDAKSKEKANENRQDIADRLQDSMAAAQFGMHNPISVTRAEMDVLYPKNAQRHWDALQGIVAAGAKAQEYDRMTPDQIAADVDRAQPTEGGPEAALRIRAYEMRASAAAQSIKARNQDPAQFAIDSGAGWKPIDLTKPDEVLAQLRSRANSQGLVSEQTGVNTPLLSKQETKLVTGWLDNQKPADRLQTLAALRSSLPNDQAYGALMRQIAPGSPITAVAGAMLDKPSGQAPAWYNDKFATPPIVPQRMLEGQEILRSKDEKGMASKFPMPGDKDLLSQFQSAVGGSNSDLFRGRPDTLEVVYAAYKAAYAAEASHRGVTNGVINAEIAQQAAQSVVGHATTYGNTNLVVPAGMDPTKFEGIVSAASKSALQAGGYSAKDIEALRGHGLRELGDTLGTGRYVVIDGNGDPLKSKTGQNTIIVDLNKVRSQHASVFEDPTRAHVTPPAVTPSTANSL